MKSTLLIVGIFICGLMMGFAQKSVRQNGPIIENYGQVFRVDDPDYELDTTKTYQVVFDIMGSPDDRSALNARINTMARFLNMHAQAGVPKKQLKVACVFHNLATTDVLNDDAYRSRYQTSNPNLGLLNALDSAGVEIYICGQSIHARGVDRSELADPVRVALSAMTILIDYQAKGYELVKF